MHQLLRRRLFGLPVFDQLQRLHQAHAAHVADERVLRLQLFQLAAQVGADGVGVVEQLFFFNHLNRGARRHRRHRVAAESGNSHSLESVGDFRFCDGSAHGRAVGHAFGGGEDVRFHVPVLDAEPLLAGAPEAGLHLVGDEEPAEFLDDLENLLEILQRGRDEPAHALDGLGQKSGDAPGGAGPDHVFHIIGAGDFAVGIAQFQRAAVAVGVDGVLDTHADHPAGAPGRMGGERLGDHGVAAVAVPQRHHFETAGRHPRQLHRGFIGFRSAVGEETFLEVAGGDLRQLFRQGDDGLVGVKRGGMLQAVNLRLHFGGDLLVTVPDADGEDAAEEIEVAAALGVENVLGVGVVHHQRLGVVVDHAGEQILLVLLQHFVPFHRLS